MHRNEYARPDDMGAELGKPPTTGLSKVMGLRALSIYSVDTVLVQTFLAWLPGLPS